MGRRILAAGIGLLGVAGLGLTIALWIALSQLGIMLDETWESAQAGLADATATLEAAAATLEAADPALEQAEGAFPEAQGLLDGVANTLEVTRQSAQGVSANLEEMATALEDAARQLPRAEPLGSLRAGLEASVLRLRVASRRDLGQPQESLPRLRESVLALSSRAENAGKAAPEIRKNLKDAAQGLRDTAESLDETTTQLGEIKASGLLKTPLALLAAYMAVQSLAFIGVATAVWAGTAKPSRGQRPMPV